MNITAVAMPPLHSILAFMNDKVRVIASISILVVGIFSGVLVASLVESEPMDQAQGTVVDFGNYQTVWTEVDIGRCHTTQALLETAVSEHGYNLVQIDDGTIVSIGDYGSADGRTWGLWAVYPESTAWVKLEPPYNQNPLDFTITSWAYCSEGEEPAIAVDYVGYPIYGYAQKLRVVSLTPTITEILASIKAGNIIVGVDEYSDYPASVVSSIGTGIDRVGTYTNPSFEPIVGTNPDVVFCDGDLPAHTQIASQLRKAARDAVVLYPGEDLTTILNNIFVVGKVIGYDLAADEVIKNTIEAVNMISRLCYSPDSGGRVDVMVSLEPDISPFVAGSGTYVSDLMSHINADNVFDEWRDWAHITSDRIPGANPDKIIVVTTEYSADEYQLLYDSLPAMWKQTDAWRDGEVYMICGDAAELVQRFGPRTAQSVELLAMMLHPDVFDTDIPKAIGDDYESYLTYSSWASLV